MPLRIVYMGTPDFAVLPLHTLIQNNYSIVGVVTAPDKPAGRGQQIQTSAIKKYAVENNLPVLQPTNLKSEEFIQDLKALQPDVIIVIAFRMLPKVVWEIPPKGTINIHASLLPQYRGSAPINWAIVNGETTTGVTSFYINEMIDTGHVILQKSVSIAPTETAGGLHDILQVSASELLLDTIKTVEVDSSKGISQDSIIGNEELKHAPKLTKEMCKIVWESSSISIYNHIRGFSPYPGAWSILKKDNQTMIFKIYFAEYILEQHSFTPGEIIIDAKNIKIATKDGYIIPIDIQLEGKKRMKIEECMRGFSFENTNVL